MNHALNGEKSRLNFDGKDASTNHELQNDKDGKTEKADFCEMEVDDSNPNKRKRIPSNSDSGPVLKIVHRNKSESNEDDLNRKSAEKSLKCHLLSQLSHQYKELVQSSKLDVDGMHIF